MIKIFSSTDKTYLSNGDAVILATKARVKNADNGDFYLDLTCGVEYNDYLQPNNIIVAPTPAGEQAFRIRSITKTAKKIEVKAWHVYYDSQNYLIQDSYAVNMTANEALDHFNKATDTTSPFTTLSNITTVLSYRCVRTSLCDCIKEVINRWGGHLKRDNWSIQLLSNIGVDNGITIEYKKNLKELTAEYNWDGVVTKLLPVGKDGILLDEIYVYSDIQYDIPYTKTVSFEQGIDEENYKDNDGNTDKAAYSAALKADLKAKAQDYVNKACYPTVNYTLKGNPEKVTDIGDIIAVKDERLGINITTEVISYEYDAIQERYVSLEFGNFTNTLSDLISNISSSTTADIKDSVIALTSNISEAITEAQAKIWDALGSSYCIYEGDKILIVDDLPASSATNVIMINSAGIGFSNTGINGHFTTAWTIDGTFNAQAVNLINLTADLIKGGTLKLGSTLNQSGKVEVYDEANTRIATLDKNGLVMYASNGGYVALNQDIGLAAFDAAGNPIYWVTDDEYHMKKSVIEEEITLCNKVRFLPMTIFDTDGTTVLNDGVGVVSAYSKARDIKWLTADQ